VVYISLMVWTRVLHVACVSRGSSACGLHLPDGVVSLMVLARVQHVAYISRGSSACDLRLPGGVGKSLACCLHLSREFGLWPTSP
jgi:hypothetical protein